MYKEILIFSFFLLLVNDIISAQKVCYESEGHLPKLLKLSPHFMEVDVQKVDRFWSHSDSDMRNEARWESIGPNEVKSGQGLNFYVSGRIKHIDYVNNELIRFVSASGGLFEANKVNQKWGIKNISSHSVTTTWGGASDTDPNDHNHILYGTGDHIYGRGTGLWETKDRGVSWQQISLPNARYFHDIKYARLGDKIWAGGNGLYSSVDNGTTWTTHRFGDFSSVVIDPDRPDTAYVSDFGKGISRTFDGGETWDKVYVGLPQEGYGRTELALCDNHPNVVYAWICDQFNATKGLWKTIDYGETWTECTVLNSEFNPINNLHLNAGDFHSTISVSPTDPDKVLIGGWWYAISDNGEIFIGPNSGSHVDYHYATWDDEGKTIYIATDGGLTFMEFDQISIFEDNVSRLNTDLVKVPTLQFVSVSTGKGSELIVGGTQDNGLIFYNSERSQWFYHDGDGGDVSAHYETDHVFHGTFGYTGEPLAFSNIGKYSEEPNDFYELNQGLKPSGEWFRRVGNTYTDEIILFTQTDNNFYYSNNFGFQWIPYEEESFDVGSINAMCSPHDTHPVVFVSGNGSPATSIMKVDLTTLTHTFVSEGLPIIKNETWPQVYTSPSPALKHKVFALMYSPYGVNADQKLFVSDVDTIDWVNITGDLPDAQFISIFVHPLDEKFILLGTDGYGVFATMDGGKHWTPYNTDLPKGSMITDFDYQMQDGKLYVIMATYGNGLYRSLLPDGPVATSESLAVKPKMSIHNENDKARIFTDIAINNDLNLEIFDVSGKIISTLTHLNILSEHCIELDLPLLPSGTYIFKLNSGKVSMTATTFVK